MPTTCITCGHADPHNASGIGICRYPACGCDGPVTTADQERREIEADQAFEINLERLRIETNLRDTRASVARIRQAFNRLASDAVYDVDVRDTAAARVVPAALAQIEVALAAIEHTAPKADQ